jgi:uncharacterized membrane protein SirB2
MEHMINTHVATWFIALILFLVALVLNKNGRQRAEKIVLMILRVFYLMIIGTGVYLVLNIAVISFAYILKMLAGLLVIGMFEIILSRVHKKKNAAIPLGFLIIAFFVALYLGYRLPLGHDFF